MSFPVSRYMGPVLLHVMCLCNGITVGNFSHIITQKVENIKRKISEKKKSPVLTESGFYK